VASCSSSNVRTTYISGARGLFTPRKGMDLSSPTAVYSREHTNNVSRPSQLDSYHYQLLSTHPDCDRPLLKVAYKNWLKLGEYGKEYGKLLLNDIAPFGVAKNLFEEITSGLMAGSDVDQVRFKEK